jgi:galactitol-specific phosphotransferase system IIB component
MNDQDEISEGQLCSQLIHSVATEAGVKALISAVNVELNAGRSNNADLIVACAQLLGQSISTGSGGTAAGKRKGILAMVDTYATIFAIGSDE